MRTRQSDELLKSPITEKNACLGCADAGIFGELGEFSFILAREAGTAIIETTHLVSESIGFHSVIDVMKEKLPEMKIEFLEVPFAYDWA